MVAGKWDSRNPLNHHSVQEFGTDNFPHADVEQLLDAPGNPQIHNDAA